MNRKTHSSPSSAAQTNVPPSLITRVRQGRHAHPADADDSAPPFVKTDSGAASTVVSKANASTAYSTNIPLLNHLIAQTRSCSRDRLLKEREVLGIIGRSKAAMRRDVSLGLFPKPVKTGTKSSAWRESEVMGWVEATTILSRVANPGFDMKDFIAALDVPISITA
ncbi:helix-turn-helix transcriptional regulator [Burkholderia pseudomallei]|uniref:helix-turn-helix transcriptional regulator n=1 Tax=Burkholderia pseudomallei TaxID=28450 RepID=UPI0005366BB5|nr:AlpA family phage regulatory protein [Burkholderia pseudomallei]KGX30455.1 prophage CP4-57 regulatory family protein [Burkholderia pseudomallei MSHR2138]KGX47783.1 prophage CP4-57 regulatory family protein [Burkholderia pseudomallei MSHR3709]